MFKASRTESIVTIWKNFKKLLLGESMNYGTSIRYHVEHACIIANKNLLLRGWSYSKHSYTRTLISNLGFFLDKIPSMLPRPDMMESNNLISHEKIGFMYFGPISHAYDKYLNIELVSELEVVELNIKLKHYDSIQAFKVAFKEQNLGWLKEWEV